MIGPRTNWTRPDKQYLTPFFPLYFSQTSLVEAQNKKVPYSSIIFIITKSLLSIISVTLQILILLHFISFFLCIVSIAYKRHPKMFQKSRPGSKAWTVLCKCSEWKFTKRGPFIIPPTLFSVHLVKNSILKGFTFNLSSIKLLIKGIYRIYYLLSMVPKHM